MYLFKIALVGWVSKLLNSGRVACRYTAVASLFQRVALPSILFLLVCSWTESHPLTLRQRFAAVYPRRWCKPPEDYREPASCRLHKERAKRKGVLHTIEPKLGSKCAQIASLDHDKKVKRSSSKCQRSRPEYLCWFWGGFVQELNISWDTMFSLSQRHYTTNAKKGALSLGKMKCVVNCTWM